MVSMDRDYGNTILKFDKKISLYYSAQDFWATLCMQITANPIIPFSAVRRVELHLIAGTNDPRLITSFLTRNSMTITTIWIYKRV